MRLFLQGTGKYSDPIIHTYSLRPYTLNMWRLVFHLSALLLLSPSFSIYLGHHGSYYGFMFWNSLKELL